MPGPMRGLGPRGFLTEEEKANMPKINGALINRILGYLKPYWLQFLLVFVTILLSAVVGLLPSIITGRIVDEALVGKNMRLLVQLLVMAFVTLTASQVISVLESVPEMTELTPEMSVFMRVMMSPCFSEVKKACGMCCRWSYIWFFMSKMMRELIHALM